MKLVYLTQVFETENDFGSDRHHFHCKKLAEKGHEVVVVTSNIDYKTGKPKHAAKGFGPVMIDHQGMRIYYVYSKGDFHGSSFKRVAYFISYLFFALKLAREIGRADIVYAVSTPLTVGLLGYRLSRSLRAGFIFEVTDVWPDVHIQMGFLRNWFLIKLLKKMEIFCYRKARTIVALSEGIRKNIQAKIYWQTEKVVLVSNGVDPALFVMDESSLAKAEGIRRTHGWQERFVCLYLGAHGRYNSLDTIIEAAALCRPDPSLLFVLVGAGEENCRLQASAAGMGLANVVFLPPIERQQAPFYLQAADAFLLPNIKGDYFRMNLQNKFFDFLASARPIVFAGCGESAAIIEKCSCGAVVPAEDGAAMARTIVDLKNLPEAARAQMGRRGREFVLANFDRHALAEKWIGFLQAEAGK
ncbi:MAG: glycosyltransferase family 4 protein [Candidatus Aminicenantes bacterium]|nr:glycosyltransferase family 4 protein [Candidatus Aminicenantes bacterium]